MMDATRVDRLSCYGYARPTTPHIDEFAAEGTVYERAFAPEVWTLPVASSIFTGLRPHHHGVTFRRPQLSSEHATLASLLAEQGYATWGVSSNAWISGATGLNRGFDEFQEPYRLLENSTLPKVSDWINRFYASFIYRRKDKGARHIGRSVKAWLQAKRNGRADRPFFMFLHFLEPHYPYRPPRPFDSLYLPDQQILEKARKIRHLPSEHFAGKIVLDEDDFELLNRLYDAEITYMDAQLGQLHRMLDESGLLETTAIILFADHGENIGHHGMLDHHFCLYDSLIHVPLIIRYPPKFPEGERIQELVQTQDIFRTVLELAGLKKDQSSDETQSLLPEEVRTNPRDHIFAETSEANLSRIERKNPVKDISVYNRKLWAVRTSRHKYIEGSDGSKEFYDLQDDPGEAHNLANKQPRAMTEVQQLLHSELQGRANNRISEEPDVKIQDPVVVERLRSLGYID
jgi:arylsulfatase A-like enzyme